MLEPLTTDEWNELAASIEHLSGPDAWDDDRLEPMLIPVTHYVPRLMAEVQKLRAVRTCHSTTVLLSGVEYVCALPFGHGPEHHDGHGTRWRIYETAPQSDDALKQLLHEIQLAPAGIFRANTADPS